MLPRATDSILTIGHAVLPVDLFISLLAEQGVRLLLDVRSSPFSGRAPQYNRPSLQESLFERGISYVTAGTYLGGRPKDESLYVAGQVQYDLVAATAHYQSAIRKLIAAAHERRTAIMCAESDPIECHRFLLIARTLAAAGQSIEHILHNGKVDSQADTEARMLQRTGLEQTDMFGNNEDRLARAYAVQSSRYAFIQPPQNHLSMHE